MVFNSKFPLYFLGARKPLLFDGATGTEFIRKGLQPSPYLNLTNPSDVKNVHLEYFRAGSDAALTNTFGAILEKSGSDIYELNRAGAELAREVCPSGKFVIGNIGPSPIPLTSSGGELLWEELFRAYEDQIEGLADGGVDGFSLETFSDLNEIGCAIEAIREVCRSKQKSLPYLCSMRFPKMRGYRTDHGVTPARAVEYLMKKGAFAIGSNCDNGIVEMTEIAKQMRNTNSEFRMIIQPNAGMPCPDGSYVETPKYLERNLEALMQTRPMIIGGCCGTTPAHIEVMRKFLDVRYG